MGPRDNRQINWRATPPTADLLDLAILVRQSVDSDPTFTIKKAAEEATRAWALDQLRTHPDVATRSAVGLTIGASASRDLPTLIDYLRTNNLTDLADTLTSLTNPAAGYTPTAAVQASSTDPAPPTSGPKR